MAKPSAPGQQMRGEMSEQPQVLARVLQEALPEVREVANVIRERDPRMVLLAARGTSDNAALYGKYLVEIKLERPAGLASPSTLTAYRSRPDLSNVIVVVVSQSGISPDLVETATVARECGATVLAVTNAANSALANSAELHLDMRAGVELAVVATKSYTAELLMLWLLVDAWQGGTAEAARRVPDMMASQVNRIDEVTALAQRFRSIDRMVLTARGYSYPTAREGALKLMEASYMSVHAFSGADLLHGPLAMIGADCPVIAVVPEGSGGAAMRPVLQRLRSSDADVAIIGGPSSQEFADMSILVDHGLTEELSPLVDIVSLQQLALVMATERGIDPDRPRGLSKVTSTW